MKKLIIATLSLFVGIQASNAVSTTGDVSVVIKKAITATQQTPMAFGTITPAAAAGVVTLSAAGARNSATLASYGTSTASQFAITAEPSTLLNITFGGGTLTSGANNMTIDTFVSTTTPASNTTDATGNLTLKVGANLNVGANQASGTYNGTYTVTVAY